MPLPATVMMSPVALTTSRITLLSVSAMNRSPAESTATAVGAVQFGGGRGPVVAAVTGGAVAGDGDDVAGRLDDLADHVVVVSAMNRSPAESTATPQGSFSSAAVAGPLSPL